MYKTMQKTKIMNFVEFFRFFSFAQVFEKFISACFYIIILKAVLLLISMKFLSLKLCAMVNSGANFMTVIICYNKIIQDVFRKCFGQHYVSNTSQIFFKPFFTLNK